jgi:hypothetical protein
MSLSARKNDVITRIMDNELCVYDQLSNKCHVLNQTAALIWQQCDGRSTIADMTAKLKEEGLPGDEDVVFLALDQFSKAGLLEQSATEPEHSHSASRRSVMRKWGAVAGLALLLPMVETITAPSAYASASSPCKGSGACP